ncbi:hypothetical protein AKJ16_DCAP12338 [Drosera capensis]
MDAAAEVARHRVVFVDTSLDTHLVVDVSLADTVSHLKQKLLSEHKNCFPGVGDIKVHALKVKRKAHYYHLSDSMLVHSAFHGVKTNWFLFAEASYREGNDSPSSNGKNVQLDGLSNEVAVVVYGLSSQFVCDQARDKRVLYSDQLFEDDSESLRMKVFDNNEGNGQSSLTGIIKKSGDDKQQDFQPLNEKDMARDESKEGNSKSYSTDMACSVSAEQSLDAGHEGKKKRKRKKRVLSELAPMKIDGDVVNVPEEDMPLGGGDPTFGSTEKTEREVSPSNHAAVGPDLPEKEIPSDDLGLDFGSQGKGEGQLDAQNGSGEDDLDLSEKEISPDDLGPTFGSLEKGEDELGAQVGGLDEGDTSHGSSHQVMESERVVDQLRSTDVDPQKGAQKKKGKKKKSSEAASDNVVKDQHRLIVAALRATTVLELKDASVTKASNIEREVSPAEAASLSGGRKSKKRKKNADDATAGSHQSTLSEYHTLIKSPEAKNMVHNSFGEDNDSSHDVARTLLHISRNNAANTMEFEHKNSTSDEITAKENDDADVPAAVKKKSKKAKKSTAENQATASISDCHIDGEADDTRPNREEEPVPVSQNKQPLENMGNKSKKKRTKSPSSVMTDTIAHDIGRETDEVNHNEMELRRTAPVEKPEENPGNEKAKKQTRRKLNLSTGDSSGSLLEERGNLKGTACLNEMSGDVIKDKIIIKTKSAEASSMRSIFNSDNDVETETEPSHPQGTDAIASGHGLLIAHVISDLGHQKNAPKKKGGSKGKSHELNSNSVLNEDREEVASDGVPMYLGKKAKKLGVNVSERNTSDQNGEAVLHSNLENLKLSPGVNGCGRPGDDSTDVALNEKKQPKGKGKPTNSVDMNKEPDVPVAKRRKGDRKVQPGKMKIDQYRVSYRKPSLKGVTEALSHLDGKKTLPAESASLFQDASSATVTKIIKRAPTNGGGIAMLLRRRSVRYKKAQLNASQLQQQGMYNQGVDRVPESESSVQAFSKSCPGHVCPSLFRSFVASGNNSWFLNPHG